MIKKGDILTATNILYPDERVEIMEDPAKGASVVL